MDCQDRLSRGAPVWTAKSGVKGVITGSVSPDLEATVRLTVCGENEEEIEAIDTGFSGFLTLPSAFVASLALTWRGREDAVLGDGSIHPFDVYAAEVIWDGLPRILEINLAETVPLIGMGMLFGHELCMKVMDGGKVTVRLEQ